MTDKTDPQVQNLDPSQSLFAKQLNPFMNHYPELNVFVTGIRGSYWTHAEFDFTRDIQDYLTNLTLKEQSVIRRTMLAISQVEVTVKRFWADFYHTFPQEEIDAVSVTFAESEVRHKDTYRHLLVKLNLEKDFQEIGKIEPLRKRVEYLEKFMKDRKLSKKQEVCSMLLFSIFVEHISLFSQFLIMMKFSHDKNMLNTIGQAVQATSKEEELHGYFGINIYHILKKQHPEMFDEEFYKQVKDLANEAFKAELDIIDWIFELGDLESEKEGEEYFLSKEIVTNYIKYRYNVSFENIGLVPIYSVDYKSYEKHCHWFDATIQTVSNTDNFANRNTSYFQKGAAATPKFLIPTNPIKLAQLKVLGFVPAE